MKVFLPPLIAFMIFAAVVMIGALNLALHIGDMGQGDIHSFIACFYYCWPLYVIAAILTQWIIIVPIWNAYMLRSASSAISTLFIVAVICALFATGTAYIIWDQQLGTGRFINLIIIMLMIQLAYWVVNFSMLFLINDKVINVPKKQ